MRKEDKTPYNLTEAKADIEKFKSWLNDDNLFNLYYKLAPRLKEPYKDIYWIMKNSTKEDLKSYLDELDSTKSKSEIKKEDLEGAKLVAENSSYKCYHITTYEASVIMGRGTKWCISMKDDDRHWKSYTAKGVKFYFFIGKNEKLALALYPKKITVNHTAIGPYYPYSESRKIITNFELFNEEDETISYKISEYNLPQIPGVKPVYIDTLENLDENGLYIDNNVVVTVNRNLTEVTIPEGVTKIGESAFQYCYSLEDVKLPNSLLSIGSFAFRGCNNLTSIEIPNSVTTIGKYAFSGCRNLTDIEISNSVTTIGKYAFYGCRNLTSVVIPSSVKTIEDGAFDGCNNLTIYCEATSQPSGWDSRWNSANRPVVWGYKGDKLEEKFKKWEDRYIVRYDGWVEPLYIVSTNPFKLGKKQEAYKFNSFEDAQEAWEELCSDPKQGISNHLDRTIFKIKDNLKENRKLKMVEDNPVIVISSHSRSAHPTKNNLDGSKDKEDVYRILEDINEEKLSKIESLINDLYELRKTSIGEGGEYSIGNLIFKEFRNKGYLDNLKDRMRELINKELSLEETKKRKKKKGISNGEMGWFTKFNTGNVPFNIGFFNMVASGNFEDGGDITGDVAGDSSIGSVAVGESLKGRNKKRYLKESMFDDKAYEYIYNYLEENYDGDDLEDSTKTILEYFINVYPETINYIDYWGKDKKTIEEIETRYSSKYITDLLSSEGFPDKLIDDYIKNYSLDLKKREEDK